MKLDAPGLSDLSLPLPRTQIVSTAQNISLIPTTLLRTLTTSRRRNGKGKPLHRNLLANFRRIKTLCLSLFCFLSPIQREKESRIGEFKILTHDIYRSSLRVFPFVTAAIACASRDLLRSGKYVALSNGAPSNSH